MPYEKLVRPINVKERAELEALMRGPHTATLSSTAKRAGIWVVAAPLLWLILRALVSPSAAAVTTLVTVAVLVFASFANYLDSLGWRARVRPRLERALACGLVSVERVEASGVIELEELEDEGPTYFFDVGGGRLLHLEGQDLYATELPWPNAVFEIVSTVNPPRYLGIFCYGEKLDPRCRVRGPDYNRIDYNRLPSGTGLIDGTLDAIEAAISGSAGDGQAM